MVLYKDLFIGLHQNQIQFLVAGGFAVNFHQVQRATVDLDLIIWLEKANVEKFVALMKSLGFLPRVPVNPIDLADETKRKDWIANKNMKVFSFYHSKNNFEVVDVFVDEPKPFSELYSRRMELNAFGATISVLSKADLIEMKRAAGRDKDLFDIDQLLKKKS